VSARRQLIEEAIKLVEVFEQFDSSADGAEDVHQESVRALQEANDKAAADNLTAEGQLLADEAAAAAAYDAALQAAKAKREEVRRAAEKLVADAQIDEGTKLGLKLEARAKVTEVFEAIKQKLEAAAAVKDEPAPTEPIVPAGPPA
jgi:hypothetical protein